jgi:hypothetical protein
MTNYTITYEGTTITVLARNFFEACAIAGTLFVRKDR